MQYDMISMTSDEFYRRREFYVSLLLLQTADSVQAVHVVVEELPAASYSYTSTRSYDTFFLQQAVEYVVRRLQAVSFIFAIIYYNFYFELF